MVSPRMLSDSHPVISKPCLPKRGEERAGKLEKRQQGAREQMLGGRLEGRLGMVEGVQAVLGEGNERGGGLRRRERTGASRRERREEESSGTGRATSSLFWALVESLLGWV